ncbi:hypothetical protein QR305_02085 [Bacteroides finegoldii]|jgi:hypothetical protein|uniref:Outer membrane protein beta-barrel domain-containing protein n=1 Tax=Bacteroides finegoldii CL09T03C10 TaxID=997888 RepID=K5CPX1_9BACE|nr:hypothetical protein [Bacteroides finegoldii]EKJ91826.1 hypothetical protein HMPREF1057_00661 [Bacteroides finegoldii CL09T03C10]
MKRIVFIILLIFLYVSASAKDIFPFNEVNSKWNISINGGYNHNVKAGAYGLGLTIKGFHLTIGGTGGSHKHDIKVDTWKEQSTCLIHVGYQIPITKSFRFIPVVGMAGAGEIVTDGSDWNISQNGTINNKMTRDMTYKFDYGAHLVYNHRKLIINLSASRYTIFAGIGLEF